MPSKDIKDLKINSLSSNPSTSVNYYFNENENDQNANVKVEAVKVQNNKIYKLISFNINQVKEKISDLYKGSNKYGSNENPLKSGTFYKIKVDKSGIFKITKQFLQQNGINPASVNPKNFRIYGNGGIMLSEYNQDKRYDALQENAIQVIGEEDGVWNDNDYALFYDRALMVIIYTTPPTVTEKRERNSEGLERLIILSISMRTILITL